MTFLVSLLVGLLVGAAYSLLGVTPPAPPLVALVGLLGMLAGANATNWTRSQLAAHRVTAAPTGDKGSAGSTAPSDVRIQPERRHPQEGKAR